MGKKKSSTSVGRVPSRPSAPSRLGEFVSWIFLGTAAKRPKRSLFVRDIQVSQEVRLFINHATRTREEKEAFADLLLRLDGDPVSHSLPILNPPVPGLRWASFLAFKVILIFDPSRNRVRVATIE